MSIPSLPIAAPSTTTLAGHPGKWSVRTRDESFRPFEPQRITDAIGKALAAADGSTYGSASTDPVHDELRRKLAEELSRRVCEDLASRRRDGGSFYVEEIQDLAELALMRAGEHEAARRFVLYREEQRRRRERETAITPDASVKALVDDLADPLLTPGADRFVMFPVRYQDIWQAYKDHLGLFWTAEEIDLSKDQQDWKKLSVNERYFLTHVLAFFAASDGIVNENLAARFYKEVASPEARAYYSVQMMIETIHSETYSLLIDTYLTDEVEKDRAFRAVELMPVIAQKAQWALRWLVAERPFAERLVAFACIEGIFFSSSFCSIYWLKDARPGLMPGLCFSNELISRDEGLHTDFAVLLHKQLQDRCAPARIAEIVAEAVAVEEGFATEALPVSLIGMNADQMRRYIRFTADRLLVQLGCPRMFDERNPFAFMERIGLQNKTNFHEKKVAEYRKAGVGHSVADQAIAFDADF